MGLNISTVGIVGGNGRMGTWFANLMEQNGLKVLRAGRHGRPSARDLARACDAVVISVPISTTLEVIKSVAPLMPPDALLMDLTSVKMAPLEAMVKYSHCQVVGMHPLFGPEGAGNKKSNIAICKGRGHEGYYWIKTLLEEAGYNVVTLRPEFHDEVMAVIQAANHFSTLVMGMLVDSLTIDYGQLSNLSTQTFCQVLDRCRQIIKQSPELFASLMMENPYAYKTIRKYIHYCEQLLDIIENKDRNSFKQIVDSISLMFKEDTIYETGMGECRPLEQRTCNSGT